LSNAIMGNHVAAMEQIYLMATKFIGYKHS
jgi:hypothetical protein